MGANSATDVRKSPNDDRKYRYLELPNKLRVLLVSDATTDKSAAALAVYRGSIHEPEERPGLAHFLEHMLFIQTHAYPEVDGFQKYISANGGSSNAYTAPDHTNYFFDIRPPAFAAGLDRFGHFFIDPILSAEYAEREKNAVHSEYQLQLKDDGWRGFMVSKQALNPAHPTQRFSIGSLDTLAGDIQADLKTFFETQYSADQMGLVVLSQEPLDELEALVRPLFGQIQNHNIGPAYPEVPPYTSEQLPALLQTETQKDGTSVSYHFPMPSTLPHYRVKPEQYFANLLGHEGTGSLYQALTRRGWIESLGASVGEFDRNTSMLSVSIELTPDGIDNVPRVTDLLLRYIDLIKNEDPQAWLYGEQARVTELGFRFQERSRPTGFVYQMAPRLDKFPPADLLVAPYLMEEFDAALIREYMSYLRADNLLMDLAGPNVETDRIEPWFEVPFSLQRTAPQRIATTASDLALPSPNPFLPDDLSLLTGDDAPIGPMTSPAGIAIWFDQDVRFGSPRAQTHLELLVAGGLETPEERAMAQLYRLMIQDSLSELVYPAYLAGLSYSVGVSDAGFEVSVSGYHSKQLVLLSEVLSALSSGTLDPERFGPLKASLIRDWNNAAKERPYVQAFGALDDTLRSGRWPRPMLVAALENKTLADLEQWRGNRLAGLGVIGLVHGNATDSHVRELHALLEKHLTIKATTKHRAQVRTINQALRLRIPVDHDDAAIVLHVQNRDDSFSSRALSSLAAQILHQEYFRELRTEQQLGYVVSISNRPVLKRGGLSFIVQSPVKGPAGLEAATLEFVRDFNARWPDITEAEFDQYRSGLVNRLLESPKNLAEQSQRYWGDLMDGYLNFDSRQQVAQIVQRLEKSDLTAYFERLEKHLQSRRLLIYTLGRFDDEPQDGRLLEDPTAPF